MKIPTPKRQYLEFLSLGGEIAASLTVPILVGHWVDDRFETSPWFMLAGILIGIALVVSALIRLMRKLDEQK